MPKYHEKPAGTAAGTKIFLIGNPSTGALEKVTLDELKTWINSGVSTPTLATPTGAAATAVSDTQINTSINPVANATGYVCERSTNGTTGWASVYTGASPSFGDTGRTASTQYFYRWKATAPGYNDSGYSSTVNATTQAGSGGGSPEYIVWTGLLNATAPGSTGEINIDHVGNGSFENSGARATKKLVKANGNYVQWRFGTLAESEGIVLGLHNNNDAKHGWASMDDSVRSQGCYGAGYHASPNFYYHSGDSSMGSGGNSGAFCASWGTGATPSGCLNAAGTGTPAANNYLRLEVSGNDLILKRGTDGVNFPDTVYTHANILAGVSDMYIKVLDAIPGLSKLFECKALGLTTI